MHMIKKEIREKATIEYERWKKATSDNKKVQMQLEELSFNEDEMVDSFGQHLRFGTSGIRGVMGIGTNRINEFVIRRTTKGLADYLKEAFENPSAVIAFDSRKNSREFAEETARVLSGNGIKVYIFSEIAPVSLLSFTITRLRCTMGIMITASHNPKAFNGYKVYNQYGYQVVGEEPALIMKAIDKIDFFDDIKRGEEGIEEVDASICDEFTDYISSLSTLKGNSDTLNSVSLIYSPLNGAGNIYVRKILDNIGFSNLKTVASQELPDGEFPTCAVPNPEKITAYAEGFKEASDEKNPVIIATDPDADRVGMAIFHHGMKVLLTGNQLGVLILDYLCTVRKPTEGQVVVRSIVTTPLIDKVAESHGMKVVSTLTGFKYIGELAEKMARQGRENDFYFGIEESNGYLVDPFIRDKDGVSAALIALEMASYHRSRGKDPLDRLEEINDKYGSCRDKTRSYVFEPPFGYIYMRKVMDYFRKVVYESIGSRKITERIDYLKETELPKADVLEYRLDNGTRVIIRPSGTEAKIKVYLYESENSEQLEREIREIIDKVRGEDI